MIDFKKVFEWALDHPIISAAALLPVIAFLLLGFLFLLVNYPGVLLLVVVLIVMWVFIAHRIVDFRKEYYRGRTRGSSK